ncbi:unnamed protein product [marine sediment metagenome]|uniref:PqqD family protein n=1 Tax=marine sediment metagenome TaxID=412755 RepID=X0X8S1_9ZZZZ
MEPLQQTILKPRPKQGISEEWIGEEIFLYDSEVDDGVLCLNSGAALIWLLCDGTREVEDIAGELATSFYLSEEQVLSEVRDTVTQLKTIGLLEG